ncbi:hypothetical protein HPB47_009132, partial [Ixodes persulcatus]
MASPRTPKRRKRYLYCDENFVLPRSTQCLHEKHKRDSELQNSPSNGQAPEEPSWAVDLSSDSHESPSDVDDVSDIEGSTQSESGNAEEGTRSASFLLDDDGLLQRCLAEFGSATLPHSTTTKAAAVAMLLSIASAHRVTWTLLEHILEFVDMLYGTTTHVLPRSKYMFRKLWCSRTSAQLKHVMSKEKKELSENMEKIEVSLSQPEVTDVTSASIYRCLRQDGVIKKGDLTLIINTDGSPLLKSSHYSSMVQIIGCTADAPARAAVQNHVTYAGYFGCPWCLIKGKHEGGCIRYAYDEDDQEPAPERTAAMVLRDTELAEQLRVAVQGVKGPSSLATVPNFDPVWGFTVDYMHCVLLGVTRQVTETLIASSNSAMAFYIGKPHQLTAINERLLCFKPPHCFTRLPRSLQDHAFWKASEWRHWLLFYVLPCTLDILPPRYWRHLCRLVEAIFLLLLPEINESQIRRAETLLTQFVGQMPGLYGETAMTFNVHQLTHLSSTVRRMGPLWANSAFRFEDGNGRLLKQVTAAKGVPQQIVERVVMRQELETLLAADFLPAA